ncbi:hypothetical protein D3C77_48980 [compost metagenome]
MHRLTDRNGTAFVGTPEELKRHNAKLRKQASRAKAASNLALPTPPGTARALQRICQAAGFEDPREFLANQIHRLDALLTCDSHAFVEQTRVTVTVGNLDKWLPLIGDEPEDGDELK